MSNRVFPLIATAVFIVAASSVPRLEAALIASGFATGNLQGYWQFDESNSASPPLANPTPDQSGHVGRDGTYQANALRATDGSFSIKVGAGNKVLSTDSALDYEVTVPEPTTPDSPALFGLGGSFTVSLWVKASTSPTGAVGTFISTHSLPEFKGWRFGYVTGGGNNNVVFVGQNNTYVNTVGLGSQPFQKAVWEFLTYTYNVTGPGVGTGTIYLNGTVIASSASMPTPNQPTTGSSQVLAIGGQAEQNENEAFKGLIDEAAIWNTALTGTQVQNLYLAYLPEPGSAALLTLGGAMMLRRRVAAAGVARD